MFRLDPFPTPQIASKLVRDNGERPGVAVLLVDLQQCFLSVPGSPGGKQIANGGDGPPLFADNLPDFARAKLQAENHFARVFSMRENHLIGIFDEMAHDISEEFVHRP